MQIIRLLFIIYSSTKPAGKAGELTSVMLNNDEQVAVVMVTECYILTGLAAVK